MTVRELIEVLEREDVTLESIGLTEDDSIWSHLSEIEGLPESFIEKYSNCLDWVEISRIQILTEEFIEKHCDKVSWYNVSVYQKLSESFIERNASKLNWSEISKCQVLSEPFIERHLDKVDWYFITKFQRVSKEFIERCKNKIMSKSSGKPINIDTFVSVVDNLAEYAEAVIKILEEEKENELSTSESKSQVSTLNLT